MYDDYGVVYETSISEFIIPMLIIDGGLLLLFIVYLIGLAKVFKKANRSGIAAIIPIYNYVVMLEIINKPVWHIVLFLVPIVNLVVYCKMLYGIAKSFRKTTAFSILTVLFPFIFIPIIGFSDSEYIGINKEAMSGISYASDKPIIKNEEIEATEPRAVTESKPLDISIGGGVYQKEYKESLLDVPEENKKVDMLAAFRVDTNQNIPVMEPEKTGADLLRNVEFIEAEEIHPSNFNMPVQVSEPTVITTGEVYDNILDINQNAAEDVDIMAIEPIPTIIEPVIEQTIPTPTDINSDIISNDSTNLNSMESSNVTNSVVDSLPANMDNSDYTKCPQCGAVVKKGASKCFMCGKEL